MRLEIAKSPVERLFPPSGGVSRGSVRVGVVKTFLLPSYGFSFGYKRKEVSIAEGTEAQSNIVGHKICAPFTSVLVCTSEQTATSRYLSLSRAFVSFGRASFAPSPFSARASAIRSRTCGRQRLAFLAASATGGARKPNPSEGGKGAPAPCTDSPLGANPVPESRDSHSVASAAPPHQNVP